MAYSLTYWEFGLEVSMPQVLFRGTIKRCVKERGGVTFRL